MAGALPLDCYPLHSIRLPGNVMGMVVAQVQHEHGSVRSLSRERLIESFDLNWNCMHSAGYHLSVLVSFTYLLHFTDRVKSPMG